MNYNTTKTIRQTLFFQQFGKKKNKKTQISAAIHLKFLKTANLAVRKSLSGWRHIDIQI